MYLMSLSMVDSAPGAVMCDTYPVRSMPTVISISAGSSEEYTTV